MFKQIYEMLSRMARGDFSRRLIPSRYDPFRNLKKEINATAEALARSWHELSGEKNRLQTILNSMIEGVVVTDGEGKIVLGNPALLALFGLKGEPLGLSVLECIRNGEIHETVEKVLSGSPPQKKETTLFAGGETKHLLIHSVGLDSGGRRDGSVSVVSDMTEIRELENARKEFVANVSHELKTPLTNIRGYAETLRSGALHDPEAAPRFLEKIEANAVHLQKLVEDILRLSEIESGRLELHLQSIDLADFLKSHSGEYRERARSKNLSFDLKISPGLPTIRADPTALAQILGNLLDNAIRYTETGGIVVQAAQKGEGIEMTVSDTGMGISPADVDRIFERFYRVDKARTRGAGGTGLGLSIVKHLVLAHGGKIDVSSEPGKGSRFRVFLKVVT